MMALIAVVIGAWAGLYIAGPAGAGISLLAGLAVAAALILRRNARLFRDDPLLYELLMEAPSVRPYKIPHLWGEALTALAGGIAASWLYQSVIAVLS